MSVWSKGGGNAGQGQNVAEVLMEPESSRCLSGLREEQRICWCCVLGFSELQVVCEGLGRVQWHLDVEIEDQCRLAGLVGFGSL